MKFMISLQGINLIKGVCQWRGAAAFMDELPLEITEKIQRWILKQPFFIASDGVITDEMRVKAAHHLLSKNILYYLSALMDTDGVATRVYYTEVLRIISSRLVKSIEEKGLEKTFVPLAVNYWVSKGLPSEERVKAKEAIITYIRDPEGEGFVLSLDFLGLRKLPNIFHAPVFQSLRSLGLSGNNLHSYPRSLEKVRYLKIWDKKVRFPEGLREGAKARPARAPLHCIELQSRLSEISKQIEMGEKLGGKGLNQYISAILKGDEEREIIAYHIRTASYLIHFFFKQPLPEGVIDPEDDHWVEYSLKNSSGRRPSSKYVNAIYLNWKRVEAYATKMGIPYANVGSLFAEFYVLPRDWVLETGEAAESALV